MGVFTKLLENIKLSKQFKRTVKPYYSNIDKSLETYSLINLETPQDVLNVIQMLNTNESKRFKRYVNNYNDLLNQANKHNSNVTILKKIQDLGGYKYLLDNPTNIDKSSFDLIINAIIDSKKYKDLDRNDFDSILNAIKNYDILCSQHSILDSYKNTLNLTKYQFIDNYNKNILQKDIDTILKNIRLTPLFYPVLSTHNSLSESISEHNKSWVKDNTSNKIFDDINGRSLDLEQRYSVLTDEVSTLVVAGAGSGKTLTICGKVKYLLEEKHVDPKDILLLSYSKNSSLDLQYKISPINANILVNTFHKLGLDILTSVKNKKYVIEEQYNAIIEKYFREEMHNRPKMLKTILSYYSLYLSQNDHSKTYKDEGELFADLKQQDFTTLKSNLLSLTKNIFNRETLKKEQVKSFEEMAIANWLFLNGINYEYEKPYEVDVSTPDKRQYTPDFYLPDYKIYIEHYGIDRDGKANQYSGEEAKKYVNNIAWKRETHIRYNTLYIETYSYEFDEGIIFDKLTKVLKEKNVVFKSLNNEEIHNALESIYENASFKSFISLIRTFINLYKASYTNENGFEELLKSKFESKYDYKRAELFIEIVKDIYVYYMTYIRNEDKIDFDDMILQSSKLLPQCDGYRFKYIIVDEFQDISVSRMKFLKELINHGNSKLFAVGDDWQAIYRFSGCDINIFLKFPEYFGKSAICKINSTHRNSQELQNIAGAFIKANPEQFKKNINSKKSLTNPVQIMFYNEHKYYAFLDILKSINTIDPNANILVLGRNNRDIESILLENRIYIKYHKSDDSDTKVFVKDYPKMNISYCTVHASKGLESDYVVIINADEGILGFPNKIEDDPLLDMVLSSKSNYEFAEERRLWYVALTRTRNYTYIITKNSNPSIFVNEILNKCYIMNPKIQKTNENNITCPRCKSGILIQRKGTSGEFYYSCNNYPYCKYTINDYFAIKTNKRCPECGDFLTIRKGPWGAFWGCSNYPKCKYTREIDSISIKK